MAERCSARANRPYFSRAWLHKPTYPKDAARWTTRYGRVMTHRGNDRIAQTNYGGRGRGRQLCYRSRNESAEGTLGPRTSARARELFEVKTLRRSVVVVVVVGTRSVSLCRFPHERSSRMDERMEAHDGGPVTLTAAGIELVGRLETGVVW